MAAQRNAWSEVTSLAERAVAIVQAGHFDDYWTSALVYAWASRAALHGGDVSRARLPRAGLPAPAPADLCPAGGVSPGAAGDGALPTSRSPTPGAPRRFWRRPTTSSGNDPTSASCRSWPPAAVQSRHGQAGAVGASSLTAAELRLLPLLSTHLSYAEIGERLYRLQEHGQVAGVLRLPEARRLLAQRAVVRTRELGLDAL